MLEKLKDKYVLFDLDGFCRSFKSYHVTSFVESTYYRMLINKGKVNY